MWETFFTWLNSKDSFLFIITALVVIVWFISGKYFQWTHRLERVEAECGKTSSKIDNVVMPKLEALESKIDNIENSFNNLIVFLKGKFEKMDVATFMVKSPIQLTDLGRRILEATGGKSFIENNLNALLAEMDSFDIKTAMDSQKRAPSVITNASYNASFNSIKDYLFMYPVYREKTPAGDDIESSLDMTTMTMIMGLYLRDKYLEKHPELKPGDIDMHPSLVT